MEEKYKFVKSIDLISGNQLVFTTRNKYYSDFKKERFVAKFNHVLLKIFFICVLVSSIYIVLRTNVIFMLILTLIAVIGLLCLRRYEKYDPVQKEILSNKDLDFIEFYDDFLNKKQIVYSPKAVKVVVRIDDTYNSYLFVSLSVDIVGSLVQGKLSNIRVAGFRYSTIQNAVSRVNDAALEFKFLADWLELPIISEECVYYYDTNCRHY